MGLADDLLTTIALVAKCPIVLVPAMNKNMWLNPTVQRNAQNLKSNGIGFLGPDKGSQACGDYGYGRMLEVENILSAVPRFFVKQIYKGKTILITAGPTCEEIDPVRYLTNRSSGKMGYALAEAAMSLGAKVILVSGPCSIRKPHVNQIFFVESASEMHERVMKFIAETDIFISCAAVSDYKVKKIGITEDKKD